jgi:hypothetical protein
MRKEIVVAIIIGLFVGFVVAYGVRTAQISLENRQAEAEKATTTQAAVSEETVAGHSLFITTPEPNAVTDKNSVAIIGSTTPNSLISIIGDADEIATIADDAGNFTGTLELNGGVNTVVIKSYNDLGEAAETSFMIIYSTADLTATESAAIEEE